MHLGARQAVCYKMEEASLQYIPILTVQNIFHPKACSYSRDDTLTCSKLYTHTSYSVPTVHTVGALRLSIRPYAVGPLNTAEV